MLGFLKKIISPESPALEPPAIQEPLDLGEFTCCGLKIGESLPSESPLAPYFATDKDQPEIAVYKNRASGLEINVTNGLVECFFVTLKNFKGPILRNGEELTLSSDSTESQVTQLFGAPYWKNIDEAIEVIDFYEYNGGTIELQFDYPPLCNLEFITILTPGVLSNETDRKEYKVNKPWPPLD